ncbi:hypothetical protein TDB9533_04135 [Thalassocella blandensis]|nr:hypothetical protein TDB9533_04135 [Thalassocella blandensis]
MFSRHFCTFTTYRLIRCAGLFFAAMVFPVEALEYAIPNPKINQARFISSSAFHTELITQALQQTDSTLGNFAASPVDNPIPASRVPESVIKDEEFNVFWAPAIKKYERPELFAIKIPLLKGLAGCRLLLVNKDKPLQEDALQNYSSLTYGVRHDWISTDIFKLNNLNTLTALNNKTLLLTLEAGRYDAIPVGADQIQRLLETDEKLAKVLQVSDLAIFHFPLPTIYYVNSNYPALADALERGLKTLLKNGQFETIFNQHFKQQLNILKGDKYKTITLKNPFVIDDMVITDSAC